MATMYFKGGKGIQNPIDFNGEEIKEGDILTSDSFDPYFDSNFYNKHYPKWSEEDISKRKHTPTYIVKWNEKGFFYGAGINQELYLHDFRFKFTKIVRK